MKSPLCIVGPTGTGKTALAVEIAGHTPSVLISADSRQVYRGMDVVTGKDHPSGVEIYGIDIVDPDEPCSVSVWVTSVLPHIDRAISDGKLPIVVGGTGLYIKALGGDIETINVPVNKTLRDELADSTVRELQVRLRAVAPEKLQSMNNSDVNNPRRLIRAIEVAGYTGMATHARPAFTTTILGIRPPESVVYEARVRARVVARFRDGAVAETKKLLKKYGADMSSMSAIGYRSIAKYIQGTLTEDELINVWTHDEIAYATRQMTWFRKYGAVKWYDSREEAYADYAHRNLV